jgi:phospholipid/cholesterol/gamma-HCH transport system permease protein
LDDGGTEMTNATMQVEIPLGTELEEPRRRGRRLARPRPGHWLAKLGRSAENIARHAGEMGLICWTSLVALVTGRLGVRQVLREMYWMGVQSLPIITVTGILSGIVTSQQGGYQFNAAVPLYVLGSVVASSIILELGPVLTAVVFIGRIGARITAELGTMKVSEQIDALHSLGRHPVRQLVAPRLLAGVIVLPLLVAYANTIGIIAAAYTARATMGLGFETFIYGVRVFWHTFDLYYSVGKGMVFGFIIPLVASHMGLRTYGGAEGVGRATTAAVVFMIMAVLVLDATFPMLFLR